MGHAQVFVSFFVVAILLFDFLFHMNYTKAHFILKVTNNSHIFCPLFSSEFRLFAVDTKHATHISNE